MDPVKVPGENRKHKVLLYAISTCAWCKLTKNFLKNNNIEYEYVDVDHCNEEEWSKIKRDILSRGGRLSYPTLIIDNKTLINGFYEGKIKEALDI